MHPEPLADNGLNNESPEERQRDKISGSLGILAVLVGVLVFAETAVVLYICYSPVPWGDMWDYWAWYVKYEGNIFWHLAAQHNEHRILTTRLFFLLDQFWFGGTNKLLAVAIPAIQLGHAVALWRLGLKVPGIRRSVVWVLGGLAVATMFSSQQFTNFTWYFQVQFVIVYFLATLSCIALMKASVRPESKYWLAGTIVLAIATTYSMANGLLIWPALVSLSFFLALSKRVRFVLAGFGVVTWIAYFTGYVRPADHPSPLTALLHLPAFFRFLVTIIGSPFGDLFATLERGSKYGTVENSAAIVGSLALVAALLFVARRLFWREEADRGRSAELVYIHLLLFALASMTLIASGRFTFPIEEAIGSRYTTPALLFWLFLLSLAIIRAERSTNRRIVLGGYGLQGAAIAMFLVFLMVDKWGQVDYARGYQQYLSEAEAAISNNVLDPPMWKHVNYSMPALLSLSKYLSAHDLSVFDEPWHYWIGQNIRKHYAVEPADRCGGTVDLVRAISSSEPGYRVEGWAWDKVLHTAPRHLILTDGSGRIIGSGIIAYPRPDVAASLRDPRSGRSGWVGYVSGLDHKQIDAYVVLAHHGRVCAAGERRVAQ